jgi:hypothetical protein
MNPVGRKVSRQEAFEITRRILQKAEQARIEAAEADAHRDFGDLFLTENE